MMTRASQKAAVIDTMVFAYGLMNETDFAEDSLAAIAHIHVPDSIKVELTNVL